MIALICRAVERGVTFFDTAEVYGDAEAVPDLDQFLVLCGDVYRHSSAVDEQSDRRGRRDELLLLQLESQKRG
jgi:aryl-alcohol dehydrogenase-like predicted oxidoreductase